MVPLYNKHRKYCIVVGCESSYLDLFEGDDSPCKLRFHKFPFKYPRVLRKWKNVLSLKRVLQKNSLVCSKHFTIDSYTSEAQKRLSRDAVPTLFIGYKVESLEEDVGQNLQCGPRTKKKILNKIHPQQKQGRKRKISSSRDSESIAKNCKTDIQDQEFNKPSTILLTPALFLKVEADQDFANEIPGLDDANTSSNLQLLEFGKEKQNNADLQAMVQQTTVVGEQLANKQTIQDEFQIFGDYVASELRKCGSKQFSLVLAETKHRITSALHAAEIERIRMDNTLSHSGYRITCPETPYEDSRHSISTILGDPLEDSQRSTSTISDDPVENSRRSPSSVLDDPLSLSASGSHMFSVETPYETTFTITDFG